MQPGLILWNPLNMNRIETAIKFMQQIN